MSLFPSLGLRENKKKKEKQSKENLIDNLLRTKKQQRKK